MLAHQVAVGKTAIAQLVDVPAVDVAVEVQFGERVRRMNGTALKLGFWSALLAAVTFLVFTVCFVAVFIVNPPFTWTDLAGYVDYVQHSNQTFKVVAQLSMLLFAPLYVILLNSIHELASEDKQVLSRLALVFGALFALLVGLFYFVQVTAVRWNVDRGTLQGIEQFIQSKPDAALAAANMLGWTLFFGLSSLFVAPVFTGRRLAGAIRVLFILNGIFCLLAGIGFVLDIALLVFVTINLGMGAAMTAATIMLAVYFRRLARP